MVRDGRTPDAMKIMPGLSCIVGRTEQEAAEKQQYLDSLTHPIVAREILGTVLGGIDLSGYAMDGPLPQLTPSKIPSQCIFLHVMDIAHRGNLTLRQTAQVVA